MKKPIVGDIFEVQLSNDEKGYVQYIGNDLEELNSDVIRVFKRRYSSDKQPAIEEIISDEIDFYSHVTGVNLGEKYKVWLRYGNSSDVGNQEYAFFRSHADPEEQRPDGTWGWPKVSKTWYIWHLGESKCLVHRLKGKDTQANPGIVFQPEHIVEKMKLGEYSGFYPSYE